MKHGSSGPREFMRGLYSLIKSAKVVGIEPAAYPTEATRRAIANQGTVTLPAVLLTPHTR
jgi:hypothetical protein